MAKYHMRVLFLILISAALIGCASKKKQADPISQGDSRVSTEAVEAAEDLTEEAFEPEGLVELVDNFLVIIDASGSKYLPHNGQIKLKIAKDIVRRFNARTPERHLTGGLRRYGFEAGAFTEKTELIYGVHGYSRSAFGNALETIRWAGGKSPLAMAMDEASDDLQSVSGYMALVIVSDGNIYEGDPVASARRMKAKYGDRLCIYTAMVGNVMKVGDLGITNKRLLEQVAKEGECGYATTADELESDDFMDEWVEDIFTRGAPPHPCHDKGGDDDGDGVCDDFDKCLDTPRGAKVDEFGCWIIDPVQFELDKYEIRPEYSPAIDEVVRVMRLNPTLKMKVNGHTCTIASEKYNMKLSHNRSMAVVDYILKQGIEPHRISMEGFGYKVPAASNDTEEGRSLNRRAIFKRVK